MAKPAKDQNWQKRQYDSFGPHFRIETANPELGGAGNIAYNLYGYSDSKDVSNIGMMGDGQLQIFADQCITVAGGANVQGGGVCVQIVGTRGDVVILTSRRTRLADCVFFTFRRVKKSASRVDLEIALFLSQIGVNTAEI